MSKYLVMLLAFIITISISKSPQNTFFVSAYKSEGMAIIEWQPTSTDEIINTSVFIDEGYNGEFPKKKILDLEKNINNWRSTPRKTFQVFYWLFAIDIKDPSQWFVDTILTPGQVYTVGIEKVHLDPKKNERSYTHIFPCELPYPASNYSKLSLNLIDLNQINNLHTSITQLISLNGNNNVIFNFNNINDEILKIAEDINYYYLFLQNNDVVKCEKIPSRPSLYGNKDLITIILKFQVFCLILFFLYFIYIVRKGLEYLNYLASDKNDPKEVFRSLILHESNSVLIMYTIILFCKAPFANQILKSIISELVTNRLDIIKDVEKVLNQYKIYQFNQIKTAMLQMLQS